jgi:hypothetical protein
LYARRRRGVNDRQRVGRVTIRRGEEWSRPRSGSVAAQVRGNDADLGAAIHKLGPGSLVQFTPTADSDLARAIGLTDGASLTSEVALDALLVTDDLTGCNVVVLGTPPDRLRRFSRRTDIDVTVDGTPAFAGDATTVVVAIGQFLRGADLVPRGHPGDGRAEVQVYALPPRGRRAMRTRLATGTHVPHPNINQRTARRIEIRATRTLALEVDGRGRPATDRLDIEVLPGRYRLLL